MTTPTRAAVESVATEPKVAAGVVTPPAPARRRKLPRFVGPLLFLGLAAGAALAFAAKYPERAQAIWHSVTGGGAERVTEVEPEPEPGPWDGKINVSESTRQAIGMTTVEVKSQTEPMLLSLLGTTEYISDTLSKIRPLFEGRVDKVYVSVGESVKKGDPLIDFYSTELAEAKSTYEIEKIQWEYERNLLKIRESLLASKTISQQLYDETKNAEMKNRQELEVARDKLLVYGLTEEDVEAVEKQVGSQKAMLTVRSPIDGLVITRDVVAGNLYDHDDTLLVIAPLDRLWVWGNVFESDLPFVKMGQNWEIEFPFVTHKERGVVEYISNRVDPATHAVRIRTSIPNHNGEFKSDMLVRGKLEIAPVEGRTVIPRSALVVDDGHSYVFVQVAGAPDKFEQRQVAVVQEKADQVIVESGLKAGDMAVAAGALLMQQMYEDARTVAAVSDSPGA